MGHVLLIFGTLIALNIGVGNVVSKTWDEPEGNVEIEETNHKEQPSS